MDEGGFGGGVGIVAKIVATGWRLVVFLGVVVHGVGWVFEGCRGCFGGVAGGCLVRVVSERAAGGGVWQCGGGYPPGYFVRPVWVRG